jgi:endonuclease III
VSSGETSKELTTLLKTLRAEFAEELTNPPAPTSCSFDPGEPVLGCFLKSFLLWESTTPKAAQALKRLELAIVDFNELRACMPDEIVRIIGERYPRAAERALRLRTGLNIIYSREHRVTLEPLAGLGRKEAREHLERIDGVPPYVAARVCLLALSHHAAPVDSRIHRRLIEAKVVAADSRPDEAATTLEKKTRAGELSEVYLLLQRWADEASYQPADSHLADLRPPHQPVAEHVRREQEAARKAARKAKLAATRPLRKKKGAADRGGKGSIKKRTGR